jgi:hypothetical protein
MLYIINRDTGTKAIGGLELPFGIKKTNGVPIDAWAGPYISMTEAVLSVPLGVRYPTMRVSIVPINGDPAFEAQWMNDLSDSGLLTEGDILTERNERIAADNVLSQLTIINALIFG